MKTPIITLSFLPCMVLGSMIHHQVHRHHARALYTDVNSCKNAFNDYWNNCINVERRTDCIGDVAWMAQNCALGAPQQGPNGTSTTSIVQPQQAGVPVATTTKVAVVETSAASTAPGGDSYSGRTGSGRATYHPDFRTNACNIPSDSSSELVTAINVAMFTSANPNLDPICGQMLNVKDVKSGNSVNVKVIDKCGCQGAIGVDLSKAAMEQLYGVADGAYDIVWTLA